MIRLGFARRSRIDIKKRDAVSAGRRRELSGGEGIARRRERRLVEVDFERHGSARLVELGVSVVVVAVVVELHGLV